MTGTIRVLLPALMISLAACGSAGPRVNVLGVTDGPARSFEADRQAVLVFLEILNPGKRDLEFSRLQYRFNAESWFTVDGEVALSRSVQAGTSAVIEVPVSLDALQPSPAGQGTKRGTEEVPYSLEGQIFARADRMERSWQINVRGVLSPEAARAARRAMKTPVRLADTQP